MTYLCKAGFLVVAVIKSKCRAKFTVGERITYKTKKRKYLNSRFENITLIFWKRNKSSYLSMFLTVRGNEL